MSDENTIWRTSSYSGSSGDCVQVAQVPGGAAVRDSKDQQGPALRFSADEWRTFTGAIKAGRI
jgi:hypothetical protein